MKPFASEIVANYWRIILLGGRCDMNTNWERIYKKLISL